MIIEILIGIGIAAMVACAFVWAVFARHGGIEELHRGLGRIRDDHES